MKIFVITMLFAVLAFAQTCPPGFTCTPVVPTGTHWASPTDFSTLKNPMGADFAVAMVAPADTTALNAYYAAATTHGIKLVIGMYPAPYTLNNGTWSISAAGVTFLKSLAANASLVKAVFVFNEPYWINDAGSQTFPCGNLDASQLRSLRTTIRGVWPAAKIYHDIGDPRAWAPGGSVWSTCIGNKYADQTGIADYVGIWYYPFTSSGYNKAAGLAVASGASQFVLNSMSPAKPVFLAQSLAQTGSFTMPTPVQIQDWNCSVRAALSPGSLMSWYVWRQSPLYSDYLANHSEMWSLVGGSACTPTVTITVNNSPAIVVNAPATIGIQVK